MNQQDPHTIRPGDPIPPDSVIGNSAFWQPPEPPKKKHTVRNVIIGITVGIFLVIGGCTALVGGALSQVDEPTGFKTVDTGPAPEPITTPTNHYTPTVTVPPARTVPVAKDFKLTVKTLSKKCFGSAGCNVTFRVLVAYSGPTLDPSTSYEVTYEVRGGEDGASVNTLTVEGDQSTVQDEEFVSTPSSKTKLTAVVTSVDED